MTIDTVQLEIACEEHRPGSEILTVWEARERWSELSKYEQKCMDDCLKLRCLGQTEDAQDIITRATNAEYNNAKKAKVAFALMHAMSSGNRIVFYEVGEYKGGRYGLEAHEYISFSF